MASSKAPPGVPPEGEDHLTTVEIKANMTSGGNAAFHNFASVNPTLVLMT